MHPELLMAASRGDCPRLRQLLEYVPALAAHQIDVAVITASASSGSSVASHSHAAVTEPNTTAAPSPSPSLIEGVTFQGDSALHVVATCGDGEGFLESAKVIHDKARRLLDARNNAGDTPLHCAARAGNVRMVRLLISLARDDDAMAGGGGGSEERVSAALRKRNERGETVLHQAIHSADKNLVEKLMSEDSGLARVSSNNGTSPLYQAILLGHLEIARLLHDCDAELSYSGPDGQNALYAAVLRGKVMTEIILDWNTELATQEDQYGSTPLHFAATTEKIAKLVLERNRSSAYQLDNSGSFPIHVAAALGNLECITSLLAICPDCAALRDAQGRTFLHVAVAKKRHKVVAFAAACRGGGGARFSSILNRQDNDGNTALHLAIQVGDLDIFGYLLRNPKVCLNLANNNGQTPLDVSESTPATWLHQLWNPAMWMHWTLLLADAQGGNRRRDLYQEQSVPKKDEIKDSKKIVESVQVVGIGSVLIATVTFAAAFTLPGGYRADDHANGGTPTLAESYPFDAFIMAITLAFISSLVATFDLMYSGIASFDLYLRIACFNRALGLLQMSVRSLITAFALAIYVVLAPVAARTSVAVCVVTFALLLLGNRDIWQILTHARILHVRLGFLVWGRIGMPIVKSLLWNYGAYIIIFCCPLLLSHV